MILPYYGLISSIGIDPVEKKPLYHFLPGTKTFSAGFFGCTLDCPFCQNYRISKDFPASDLPAESFIPPDLLIKKTVTRNLPSIAFTYSEPSLHIEYVMAAAEHAHKAGLSVILVTNGFLKETPAKELLSVIDAVNIDLKGKTDSFYRQIVKGKLHPVERFIEIAVEKKVHTEITTLLIPGENDSPRELESSARFISGLNREIPWHISAYHPAYKYTIPATTSSSVFGAVAAARKFLDYVYPGNTAYDADTVCPGCGNEVINRNGYSTLSKLAPDGSCPFCGKSIAKILSERR
jgi:pyruvate formate lyase activating enzyme